MESIFDSSVFNERLFFPRPDATPAPPLAVDLFVPVEGAELHLRWHRRLPPAAPTLLLFHGNGETVADYDEAAQTFEECGVNLAVVDYRGYGRSSGTPTLRSLVHDAPRVVAHLRNAGGDPLIIMGRSLGSVCAVELYASDDGRALAFILESGLVDTDGLIRRRGFDPARSRPEDRSLFDAEPKLGRGTRPLLVLHGANDTLIAPSEGERAFAAAGTKDKTLVIIPGRGHNDVSLHPKYWEAIRTLVDSVEAQPGRARPG